MFSWVHFPKHSAAEWHKWLGEVFLLCFWLIRDRKRNGIWPRNGFLPIGGGQGDNKGALGLRQAKPDSVLAPLNFVPEPHISLIWQALHTVEIYHRCSTVAPSKTTPWNRWKWHRDLKLQTLLNSDHWKKKIGSTKVNFGHPLHRSHFFLFLLPPWKGRACPVAIICLHSLVWCPSSYHFPAPKNQTNFILK